MLKEHTLALILLLVALGQIILAISFIVPRLTKSPIYIPLLLFFVSSGVAFTAPAINSLWPSLTFYSLLVVMSVITIHPVALWMYVKGLTSPILWSFKRADLLHFAPALIAILLSIYLTTPSVAPLFDEIFLGNIPHSQEIKLVILALLLLFTVYLFQTTVYLILMARLLVRYRHQLLMLFSSNEKRELFWVIWLIVIFSATWIAVLLYLIPFLLSNRPLTTPSFIASCYFAMIWTLCVWGLRQKPGFDQLHIYTSSEQNQTSTNDSIALEQLLNKEVQKYQRSALAKPQATSIAIKLNSAMYEHRYYLDASLSLPELAKLLKVPANYLSQTLNEHIGESFFDYVNRWRTEYAKTLLSEGKMSLIDVAMASGFNAKSSFYKAFKKHTRTTPGQFKVDPF